MAGFTINLTKTPEQLEQERAEEARKQYLAQQEHENEASRQLMALHKKIKRNKIIAYSCFIVIMVSLIIFGTVNTFFKTPITEDDVQYMINSTINQISYPTEGLDSYLRNNCDTLFERYAVIDKKNNDLVSMSVDKNSFSINRVIKISNTLAYVYFDVDILTTHKDYLVTDEGLIKQLKQKGFTDVSYNTSDDPDHVEDKDSVVAELEYIISNEKVSHHYYMTASGAIMCQGDTDKYRYTFSVPVELYLNKGVKAYRIGGYMTLYSLEPVNNSDFNTITINDAFAFTPERTRPIDAGELEEIQIKVDSILKDLYAGNDTRLDFFSNLEFNTYGATYEGLTSIQAYEGYNSLEFNSLVTYMIKTPQGFLFEMKMYLRIEQNGNSYKITKIM